MTRFLLLLSLLAASSGLPETPGAAGVLLAKVDEIWKSRDEPGRLEEIQAMLEEAERAAPRSYGVLWRLSRLYSWTSDDPGRSGEERSGLGRKGWEYGDRATAVNPDGVEGWFYAAGGMGNYALGIGVLEALGQGIEGKFRERLSRAEAIDPGFLDGAIWNAWGRFYFELPWPKYDGKKSEQSLRRAIRSNPAEERGRVYLAELYLKEGHPKEARRLLEEAVSRQPGSYDAPEERRYQKRAQELLAKTK